MNIAVAISRTPDHVRSSGRNVERCAAARIIAEKVSESHGSDHMGAAWLHARELLDQRLKPDAQVPRYRLDDILSSYDPDMLDPDQTPFQSIDGDRPHAPRTPFQEAQLSQSREIVRKVLRTIPPRREWTLRHYFGIGMEHLEPAGSEHTLGWHGIPAAFPLRHISERIGTSREAVKSHLGKATRSLHRFKPQTARLMDALDQIDDVDVVGSATNDHSDIVVPVRSDAAAASRAMLDRQAEHCFSSFPELEEARRMIPVPSSPREDFAWVRTNWHRIESGLGERCLSWKFPNPFEDIRAAYRASRNDRRRILDSLGQIGISNLLLVPAFHPSRSRHYELVVPVRMVDGIPSSTIPFPGIPPLDAEPFLWGAPGSEMLERIVAAMPKAAMELAEARRRSASSAED